jgi:GNAT superfamily N-acetyltransferase
MVEMHDLSDEYMHFVASCTHVDATDEEVMRANTVREAWLRDSFASGLKVKVAVADGRPVGFAHCVPIEMGTWGMSGEDLMTVPCLTLEYGRVYARKQGSGCGRALMDAVEAEARRAGKKGVAVLAYEHDFGSCPHRSSAGSAIKRRPETAGPSSCSRLSKRWLRRSCRG